MDFSQEEGGPVPLRKSPLSGEQWSQACVQNRKGPFQEHQRQEALLVVPGTSCTAGGLSSASGQVGHPLLLGLVRRVT